MDVYVLRRPLSRALNKRFLHPGIRWHRKDRAAYSFAASENGSAAAWQDPSNMSKARVLYTSSGLAKLVTIHPQEQQYCVWYGLACAT